MRIYYYDYYHKFVFISNMTNNDSASEESSHSSGGNDGNNKNNKKQQQHGHEICGGGGEGGEGSSSRSKRKGGDQLKSSSSGTKKANKATTERVEEEHHGRFNPSFDGSSNIEAREKATHINIDPPKGSGGSGGGGEPSCMICGRNFHSYKAYFGHLRKHPERQWRGAYPPPTFKPHYAINNNVLEEQLPATLLRLAHQTLDRLASSSSPSSSSSRRFLDIDLNEQPKVDHPITTDTTSRPSSSTRNEGAAFDLNMPPPPDNYDHDDDAADAEEDDDESH